MILGQEAQDVLLREARPAPVIEDEQSERAARPCGPQGKSSRFGDIINPQSESVEGLLPLQPERPAEGQGHPSKDLGTGSHLELQRTPPRHGPGDVDLSILDATDLPGGSLHARPPDRAVAAIRRQSFGMRLPPTNAVVPSSPVRVSTRVMPVVIIVETGRLLAPLSPQPVNRSSLP